MTKQLTPKQAAFCREYIVDCNGTQAAIRAGYSKKTAKEQATVLLTKLHIQSEVSRLRKSLESAAIATYEEACARMTKILTGEDDALSVRACERLAKLRGWDQPDKLDVENRVTQFILPPNCDPKGTEFDGG